MKRRTLDIMFSVGGFLLAGLLVAGALILNSDANFSKKYVRDQLSAEEIEFKAADKLTPKERAFTEARTGCVITYAGQALITGRQAECYANEVVGAHLTYLPELLGYTSIPYANGKTFRELGAVQGDLRAKIAAAKTSGDQAAVTSLEQQLADVTAVRQKMFEGTMNRNALLTSYGFSVLGERGAMGARVAFAGAALLFVLAIAGFVHAFVTPKTKAFAAVDPLKPDVRPRAGATA